MVPLSLLLLVLPFVLLFVEGKKPKSFFSELGLSRKKPFSQLFSGFKLFLLLAVVLFLEGIVFYLLGVMDTNKVAAIMLQQPIALLVVAVTLAPVAEELFFRGYLQKRIGVVFSSAIFAVLHWGYGSVAEVLAAFTMSLLVGNEVRKNKNVVPAIVAHSVYNLFSIIITFAVIGSAAGGA